LGSGALAVHLGAHGVLLERWWLAVLGAHGVLLERWWLAVLGAHGVLLERL
jgi:hypothetical protein